MSQPEAPKTRQSGPEAKPAPAHAEHGMPPGGPVKETQATYRTPGATPNLRGVEPNTAMHKGTPNPEQKGSDIRHGDHNPGMGQAGMTHRPRVPEVSAAKERTADKSTKVAPPKPDPMGVRK
jgi:hypothetical protein